jgi:hypothetical protein
MSDATNEDPRHQPMGAFTTGDVMSGFHVDLRGVASSYGSPREAEAWLELLVARRELVLPVTVLQLGMGAWQRSLDAAETDREGWARVARLVAEWAVVDMDGHGRFIHHQPMPHTYRIPAPWFSAMAQALGVGLLVRHGMGDDAARAARSLLEPSFGLITETEHGPILEEYPAEPRPHVLNGWMWALYGLYDLAYCHTALPDGLAERARDLFDASLGSLAAHLPLYETGRGWSTYDRYPHAIANIASPFYHRLHVQMLRATARLAPGTAAADELLEVASRWEEALARPITRAAAVARKVGFRIVKPRGKAA